MLLLPFLKSVRIVHFWLNTIEFAAQPSGANVGAGTRWAIFVSFLAAFWGDLERTTLGGVWT